LCPRLDLRRLELIGLRSGASTTCDLAVTRAEERRSLKPRLAFSSGIDMATEHREGGRVGQVHSTRRVCPSLLTPSSRRRHRHHRLFCRHLHPRRRPAPLERRHPRCSEVPPASQLAASCAQLYGLQFWDASSVLQRFDSVLCHELTH